MNSSITEGSDMGDIQKMIACFRELDFRFDIDRFEDRLVAQKIVCLLDLKDLDLGYQSDLYLRGPYSPDLTLDLYRHHEELKGLHTETRLNDNEKLLIGQLKEMIGLTPSMLEIAATYGYLKYRLHLPHQESLNRLRKMKPFYSQSKIILGISKANQFLFNPDEDQIADMKEEFSAWEKASIFK
jgi:uncharacterized protein YwgA